MNSLRTFLSLTPLCVCLAALSGPTAAGEVPVTKKTIIDVVYMGDKDCPPCVEWKLNSLPKLKAAPYFPQIRFTEIKKPIADPVPPADQLPDYLRPMQPELVRIINRPKGSPMFALLVDGKAIAGGWGREAYYEFRPQLEELATRKAAAK